MKAFFVFSGQGAQTVGMGKDLYESSSAAKEVFEIANLTLGKSISDLCFNGTDADITKTINANNYILHSYRKLKYFRDIPRAETATPGEATYLYYFKKSNLL